MNLTPESTAGRLSRCLPRFAGEIHPETQIEELALDSIDTVEFLCSVHEEFGVRLRDDDFFPGQTIAGLLARLERSSTPALK